MDSICFICSQLILWTFQRAVVGENTGNLPAVDCFAWVRWKSLQEGAERLPSKEQTYPEGRAPGAGLGERHIQQAPSAASTGCRLLRRMGSRHNLPLEVERKELFWGGSLGKKKKKA